MKELFFKRDKIASRFTAVAITTWLYRIGIIKFLIEASGIEWQSSSKAVFTLAIPAGGDTENKNYHDPNGNLTGVTDEKGHTTGFGYNDLDRLNRMDAMRMRINIEGSAA